ncbi:MAG: DUF433 domain-containing protein [Acidobacteriota bacterium]
MDEHGAVRIGDSNVPLDSIVAAFQEGDSPEAIQEQYPALSLEEVWGAIAAYLANRNEIEKYLKRQDRLWKKWAAAFSEHPNSVIGRLRALRRSEAGQGA